MTHPEPRPADAIAQLERKVEALHLRLRRLETWLATQGPADASTLGPAPETELTATSGGWTGEIEES